jgi:outer membrane protein
MTSHNKIIFLLVLVLMMPVTSFSREESHGTNKLTVKLGPAFILPNDDSSRLGDISNSSVSVESAKTLGITFDYKFSPNWSAEFLGIIPTKHDINGRGSLANIGEIADVKVLPPTLTLKYHINNSSAFTPFIGAGINHTIFFDKDVTAGTESTLSGNTQLKVDNSWGLALQAGFDFDFGNNWLLSSSVWYIDVDADASLNTGDVQRDIDIDIDPWVIMLGIGKRFDV